MFRKRTKVPFAEYIKLILFKLFYFSYILVIPILVLHHNWYHYLWAFMLLHAMGSIITLMIILPTHWDELKKLDLLPLSNERTMLEKITTYYALNCINEDKGWYLETDYMDGSKTKAIRRTLNKLTQELRPELKALVDAFGIPDESLGAEILNTY